MSKVKITDVDSGSATAGQVPVANGSGAAAWASPPFGFAFQRDISALVASKPVMQFASPLAWVLPISIPGSAGDIGDSTTTASTAPSAQTDFDIQSPPGTSIGTMRFAAAAKVATFIKAAATSVPAGQVVLLMAPAALNGMAGMLFASILGTR